MEEMHGHILTCHNENEQILSCSQLASKSPGQVTWHSRGAWLCSIHSECNSCHYGTAQSLMHLHHCMSWKSLGRGSATLVIEDKTQLRSWCSHTARVYMMNSQNRSKPCTPVAFPSRLPYRLPLYSSCDNCIDRFVQRMNGFSEDFFVKHWLISSSEQIWHSIAFESTNQ